MPSMRDLGGEARLRPHLERAVDARDRRADQPVLARSADRAGSGSSSPARARHRRHAARTSSDDAHARLPPARPSTALIVRCASSILNALSRSGAAAASSASAAARKLPRVAGWPRERLLRLPGAPRLVRDAAEREPHVPDGAVLHLERRGDRDQREGVARAVAHLAIGRARGERQRRQLDRGDQLAGLEHASRSRDGRRAGGGGR